MTELTLNLTRRNFVSSGQEEETIEYDEETKITPFNMKDEMDDGHFDSEGTFIFKKDKEEIKDAWLDNIDWNMVG